MTHQFPFIPYTPLPFTDQEILERSSSFYNYMNKRRSIRAFSDQPVSKEIIQYIIMTASTAPSGAHKQPWSFCAISSAEMKSKIRQAAEKEEHTNYNSRMSEAWLEDLAPFETNWEKPFLEIAPWLIVVFKKAYDIENGTHKKNYYVNESVGIATGMLLAAIHQAGLVSLTHTPSPMNFLQKVLARPENERAFMLIPVGYPAEGVQVPDLKRKPAQEIITFYE